MVQAITRNIEDFNRDVANWGRNTRKQLVSSQTAAGIQWYSDNLSKVEMGMRKEMGTVNLVRFSFVRYGVFVEVGAGRGHGGAKGGSWTDKNGMPKKTNPESLGKMNTGNRKAKPWFNQPIEREVGTLAAIVAQDAAESIAEDLYQMIKIKNF